VTDVHGRTKNQTNFPFLPSSLIIGRAE
jgi:hypothetical protein